MSPSRRSLRGGAVQAGPASHPNTPLPPFQAGISCALTSISSSESPSGRSTHLQSHQQSHRHKVSGDDVVKRAELYVTDELYAPMSCMHR
eukprot:203364-Prorocentrum_minimum.AAC.2